MTPSNEALDYEHVVKWLGQVADASAKGAIVDEMELPGGRWVVSEEWPSRVDFLKYARERHAIEGMIYHHRKTHHRRPT